MGFPNLPGIPPLAGGLAGAVTLASSRTSSLLDLLKPSWGIYDSTGKIQVLKPDAFLSVMYHNESNLPMFALEQGAFDTYNKVSTPYDITVRVAKGNQLGFGADKMSDFLKAIEKILADVQLYSIITPDYTYINANLKGFDYKREMNNGAGIIVADLHFVEIMQAKTTKSTATATTVLPDKLSTVSSAVAAVQNGACAPLDVVSTAVQSAGSTFTSTISTASSSFTGSITNLLPAGAH